MWKNRSRIAVTRGWKRFFYDLHVAGGIYVSFIVLAMALTGLTWSFQWYRNGAYALLGAGGKVATAQQSAPRSKDTTYDSAKLFNTEQIDKIVRRMLWTDDSEKPEKQYLKLLPTCFPKRILRS
jgi:uncharacterized iron-regulated membrane protein